MVPEQCPWFTTSPETRTGLRTKFSSSQRTSERTRPADHDGCLRNGCRTNLETPFSQCVNSGMPISRWSVPVEEDTATWSTAVAQRWRGQCQPQHVTYAFDALLVSPGDEMDDVLTDFLSYFEATWCGAACSSMASNVYNIPLECERPSPA